ncbi:hypothetical protein [Methylobacterium platani]|uniref:Uncharacterized protein n=2 Tax=Methylobacterium platani TaxID=427683 RepID=A0A179SD00_9HYPH|nr:hypothetical protein [Methylobacterium platani]KMO16021.1 hypothetical protein SQ03_15745 [Methylobacterium platani JCM 14648]OAS24843.1 hypothetical protein A5481_12165 [Methylobacterium platani]
MAKRNNPFQGDLFTTDAFLYTAPGEALDDEATEALRAILGASPKRPWTLWSARQDKSGAVLASVDIEGQPRHELQITAVAGRQRYQWLAPQMGEPFELSPGHYAEKEA